MSYGTCRGKDCNATINWIETASGQRIPLNPGRRFVRRPLGSEDTIIVMTREGEAIIGAEVPEAEVEKLRDGGMQIWEGAVPHHVTCPNAGDFKKKRSKNSKGLRFPKRRLR